MQINSNHDVAVFLNQNNINSHTGIYEIKRIADSLKVLPRCVQIYKYSPTLKPLTNGVNNTDYLVTVQHSAGKLSFMTFMWIILLTFATHLNTVALWQRQRLIPPPARQPQCKTCSGTTRGTRQRASSTGSASRLTDFSQIT